MKTKTFDCVEMMHEAAFSIYEETKGMSVEEEIEYWRDRERDLSEKPVISQIRESSNPKS